MTYGNRSGDPRSPGPYLGGEKLDDDTSSGLRGESLRKISIFYAYHLCVSNQDKVETRTSFIVPSLT